MIPMNNLGPWPSAAIPAWLSWMVFDLEQTPPDVVAGSSMAGMVNFKPTAAASPSLWDLGTLATKKGILGNPDFGLS